MLEPIEAEDVAFAYSNVTLYMNQLKKDTLLTAEEELELALAYKAGDESAKEKLIVRNLRLVVSIAKKYLKRAKFMELQDLIAEGNLGLIKAIEKFKPELGFRLSTYATPWIHQAVERALYDNDRSVRIPVHIHKKYFQQLGELKGRDPATPEEIELSQMFSVTNVELDASQEESDSSLLDVFTAESNGEDYIMERDCKEGLHNALNRLPSRERRILYMRYGFGGYEEHTLEEIAADVGVTRERIRQIQKVLLDTLKPRVGKFKEYIQ